MIDRKVIMGMVLVIAIISGAFMVNKSKPAVAEKEVGYDLINNDNSVVSVITSSYIKDGNLIIHISNPNNEKIQIIGLEGKKYKIKSDEVIIYDYKGEQFKLKIGSQSDVYEFGNWIKEGDKVYVDNSSWGKLEAYPHTIHSSGWVYFNVTVYKNFGDLDFLWGFNTTEVKPVKAEFYKPHFVNWTTNHSAFFYNVSSISITDEPCDYGNEYNSYKRKITYQVCSQWNETTWECEKYNTTSAVVCFDSYEQNGTNYTAFWHTKHSRIENWINVGKYFNHIEYNYGGMNRWYFIKNFEIEPNKTYTVRAYVKVPVTTEGTSGKYFFAVKRSAETLSEAISNGHFMVLDPWWNSSWNKKRPIYIDNTGGSAQTYYQVSLNISYDSDMQPDFDDIRVVNETSGETVPYWIENKSDGSWCKLWFNASYIPASSWCNDTYYLYYGNPSASSASDGDATFEFFDDFEDGLGDWTQGPSQTPLEQSNEQAHQGTYSAKCRAGHADMMYRSAPTPPFTIGAFIWDDGSYAGRAFIGVAGSGGDPIRALVGLEYGVSSSYYFFRHDTTEEASDVPRSAGWRRVEVKAASSSSVKLYIDETEVWSGTVGTFEVYTIGKWWTSYYGYHDDFYVRKYADPEPTASLGSEEQFCPPIPIITGNTTYNFGVNYTFTEGSGGLDTDSFNISWKNNTASGWQNGTTDLYFNHTTQPHGYVAIDIWAYNSTEGKLSESPASDNVTVPNNAPVITNTSDWEGDEGELVYLDFDCTDADGDTCTFSTNATKGSLNTTTGVFEWQTDEASEGTYIWYFKVEDGWGGEDIYIATITVNDLYQPTNMSILNESINLLLKEQKMTGLSFLLGILIIAALVFLLLGVLVPNSVLTLMGAVTSFIAMALPIPMMPDYPYFGIALTGVLFLFGIIGFIITFYQWLTSYREGRGYRKWERYFE